MEEKPKQGLYGARVVLALFAGLTVWLAGSVGVTLLEHTPADARLLGYFPLIAFLSVVVHGVFCFTNAVRPRRSSLAMLVKGGWATGVLGALATFGPLGNFYGLGGLIDQVLALGALGGSCLFAHGLTTRLRD